MRIRLNCRSGSLTGQAFEFDGPTVTLGSEPDCTLQLDAQKEPRVSHRHCEFFEKDEQWFVKDLKSRNGTLVNGFRIHEPVPVQFGSSIRLGKDGPEFSLAAPRSDSPLTMMGELFPDKAMKVQRTKLGGDSDEESKKRLKTEIVLTCTRGALEGQSFSFEEPLITLGRDPSNKLQVDPEKDLRASGKHCEIFLLAGRFIVRDLESSHGTFVDGKRVAEPTLLTDGSTLALGQQGPLFAVKVANSMALPSSLSADVPTTLPPTLPPTMGPEPAVSIETLRRAKLPQAGDDYIRVPRTELLKNKLDIETKPSAHPTPKPQPAAEDTPTVVAPVKEAKSAETPPSDAAETPTLLGPGLAPTLLGPALDAKPPVIEGPKAKPVAPRKSEPPRTADLFGQYVSAMRSAPTSSRRGTAPAPSEHEEQDRKDFEAKALREREEQERKEREAKAQLEREEQERREREAKAQREREEQERKEREAKAQREREEQERKEREAKAQHEREEQERKEREAKAQHEREEQERKEREAKAQHEREEQERKDREAKAQRKREEQERKEREAKAQHEREEQERKEREAKAQLEREEQERKEREAKAQREREEQERKECEAKAQHEREEQERKEREEREAQRERERKELERKAQEAKARREREEQEKKAQASGELLAETLKPGTAVKKRDMFTRQEALAETLTPGANVDRNKLAEELLPPTTVRSEKSEAPEPPTTKVAPKDQRSDLVPPTMMGAFPTETPDASERVRPGQMPPSPANISTVVSATDEKRPGRSMPPLESETPATPPLADTPFASEIKPTPKKVDKDETRVPVKVPKSKALEPVTVAPTPPATPPSPPPSPGRVEARPIDEDEMPEVSGYSFIGKIGNGPLGAVFRVRHNVLKRPMALKLILATPDFPAFGEEDRGRFKSDIESAAYLEHPNIAQVFAVGSYRDNPQVAQEFLAGGDLAKRTAGRPQDPKWAAATIGKLARALHAGHEKGICHRDLKPTNIVFTEDGEAKITDYGIARLMETKSEATKKGVPFGELCYMSPEQVKAEPTRMQPPSDVYSLGAILYELLCGKPPFPRLYQGVLTGDLMKMVVEQEPPPPSQVLSEVAKPLENIAMQSLRKDPGERYASAAEFADDLDRFLKGEKVRARSPGFFKRIFGW